MSEDDEPTWVDRQSVLNAHEEIIRETGGVSGVRDETLLDSALMRPVNHFHYEGQRDMATLAATYGVGVAKNHPFADGNKRAAFMCLNLFLESNGLRLTATDDDATKTMYAVAASEMDVETLAEWVRKNSAPT